MNGTLLGNSKICLLKNHTALKEILNELRESLSQRMVETGDPRSNGETEIWDSICWHAQVHAEVKTTNN